ELVRTDYDISRAQEKILRAGLPPFLAARLQSGH
ncbi:MAG TPA: metallophosphoesterase, partial [Candidatus Latescibacteria bacterium]|nr:metallophosphoesterase [Candidatus Latescibacterota bacterium]